MNKIDVEDLLKNTHQELDYVMDANGNMKILGVSIVKNDPEKEEDQNE